MHRNQLFLFLILQKFRRESEKKRYSLRAPAGWEQLFSPFLLEEVLRHGGNEHGESRHGNFYRNDKLVPVITLVLHLGTEMWDGPLSLHEMLTIQDSRVLQFIPEYRINLIDPARMEDGELDKFQTSLREVLGYIKHCGNGAELLQYARTEKRLQNLERDAIAVIAETTNTKIRIPEEQEETGNMCKGIEELIEAGKTEGLTEGRAEGKAEGVAEGIEKGRAEGIAEGIEKGEIRMLISLLKEGDITLSTAARKAGMTEVEFKEKFLVK